MKMNQQTSCFTVTPSKTAVSTATLTRKKPTIEEVYVKNSFNVSFNCQVNFTKPGRKVFS